MSEKWHKAGVAIDVAVTSGRCPLLELKAGIAQFPISSFEL
jgi:hypothetical protein